MPGTEVSGFASSVLEDAKLSTLDLGTYPRSFLNKDSKIVLHAVTISINRITKHHHHLLARSVESNLTPNLIPAYLRTAPIPEMTIVFFFNTDGRPDRRIWTPIV